MIDGLGVTQVEGVFRNAAEITMQLLRDNKDVLMSVLDAFIHDPLVEWEDEKRKMVCNSVLSSIDVQLFTSLVLGTSSTTIAKTRSSRTSRRRRERSQAKCRPAIFGENGSRSNREEAARYVLQGRE
jgi:serine/threonine-protein kinase ATR